MPRRLQKRPPEGHEHKTLVNGDRIWGVFLLSFSCPLRFLSRGSEFLCGAVLAAPSVPQGCLGGPFGVLCARPGAPRRGHRTVVIGCFWGLSGVLWGARWGLARFLRFRLVHTFDKLEVGLRGKRPFRSVARDVRVLRSFGRGPGVAGWPGGGPGGL